MWAGGGMHASPPTSKRPRMKSKSVTDMMQGESLVYGKTIMFSLTCADEPLRFPHAPQKQSRDLLHPGPHHHQRSTNLETRKTRAQGSRSRSATSPMPPQTLDGSILCSCCTAARRVAAWRRTAPGRGRALCTALPRLLLRFGCGSTVLFAAKGNRPGR